MTTKFTPGIIAKTQRKQLRVMRTPRSGSAIPCFEREGDQMTIRTCTKVRAQARSEKAIEFGMTVLLERIS
jgi:hypothetical protein